MVFVSSSVSISVLLISTVPNSVSSSYLFLWTYTQAHFNGLFLSNMLPQAQVPFHYGQNLCCFVCVFLIRAWVWHHAFCLPSKLPKFLFLASLNKELHSVWFSVFHVLTDILCHQCDAPNELKFVFYRSAAHIHDRFPEIPVYWIVFFSSSQSSPIVERKLVTS